MPNGGTWRWGTGSGLKIPMIVLREGNITLAEMLQSNH